VFFIEVGNPHARGVIVLFIVIGIPNVILIYIIVFIVVLFLLFLFLLLLLLLLAPFTFAAPTPCGHAFDGLDTFGPYHRRLDHQGFRRIWTAPKGLCHSRGWATSGDYEFCGCPQVLLFVVIFHSGLFSRRLLPPWACLTLVLCRLDLLPVALPSLGLAFAGLDTPLPLPSQVKLSRPQESRDCPPRSLATHGATSRDCGPWGHLR
jgi:hypothetical protein